jgi:hypothetical protein
MTEEVDFGATGAKRQTWSTKDGARAVLARIVEDNPHADDEAIFHMFFAESPPYVYECLRYWVSNNLRALRPRAVGESVDRTAARAKVEARLLDYVLPNGKMLRDCTFGECAEAGGWLTELSRKGQPGEKVGAVLSEKEVRAVWKA